MQYSVYSKLCINSFVANKTRLKLERTMISKGSIRYLIITEKQYQSIVDINNKFTFQEKIINKNRMLIIGGNNDN